MTAVRIAPAVQRDCVSIGQLIPSIHKQAIMAAYEAGNITRRQACRLIRKEGLVEA